MYPYFRRSFHVAIFALIFAAVFLLYAIRSDVNYQIVAAPSAPLSTNLGTEKVVEMENDIIPEVHGDRDEPEEMETENSVNSAFNERIVHLDLKGAPPMVSYYQTLFPLLSRLGATGLLLEYEDMFPYSGVLSHISAKNAYTKEDVAAINKLAEEANLEVIPLVQTFGHLEFILKLEEERDLREVPQYAEVICPSKNKTTPLLHEMLRQVRNLHPGATRLHIGSDEVYYIGKCDSCQERLLHNHWSNSDLFLDHVTGIARYVRDSLQAQALMWDDEFRSLSESELRKWDVGDLVEIVIWQYSTSVSSHITPFIMNKYLSVFKGLWVASAFKGATGPDQFLTSIEHHVENHLSWISFQEFYKHNPNITKLRGIMMTGWQRYDHFSVLCELLPVGLPSLAVNMLLVSGSSSKEDALNKAQRILQCRDPFLSPFSSFGIASSINECKFPGAEVFEAVQHFSGVKNQLEELSRNPVVRGWMSKYNVKQKFSSPGHVDRIGNQIYSLKNNVEANREECQRTLGLVYDEHTINEWIETYVTPVQTSVDSLLAAREALLAETSWPRRPLDLN